MDLPMKTVLEKVNITTNNRLGKTQPILPNTETLKNT